MKELRHLLPGLLSCALVLGTLRAQDARTIPPAAPPSLEPTRFAKDIDAFLAADKTHPPPRKAILFIGSSIFRQWTKLPRQMAPLPVFNRAFGGSVTTDLLYYMDKVVLPYEPRIIVYYCGSNDVLAGRNAEEIFDGFRLFVERVHATLPQTRISYVSINRAPQEQDKWDIVDGANNLARNYCAKNKWLTFIDVNPALFDKTGQPRMDLYLADKLHLKQPAYDAFAAIIKPVVTASWTEARRGTE
jgi:lysophospholipase L1-like esterase